MIQIIPLLSNDVVVGMIQGLIIGIIIMIIAYFRKGKARKLEKQEREIVEEENRIRNEKSKKEDSLYDLKEKGIITDKEYSDKMNKIKAENHSIEVTKSKEYGQLKSLYEDGTFTKEEFENKVKILIEKYKGFNDSNLDSDLLNKNTIDQTYFIGIWQLEDSKFIFQGNNGLEIVWKSGKKSKGNWSYDSSSYKIFLTFNSRTIIFRIIEASQEQMKYINEETSFIAYKKN